MIQSTIKVVENSKDKKAINDFQDHINNNLSFIKRLLNIRKRKNICDSKL
jgi:hypothetical protein